MFGHVYWAAFEIFQLMLNETKRNSACLTSSHSVRSNKNKICLKKHTQQMYVYFVPISGQKWWHLHMYESNECLYNLQRQKKSSTTNWNLDRNVCIFVVGIYFNLFVYMFFDFNFVFFLFFGYFSIFCCGWCESLSNKCTFMIYHKIELMNGSINECMIHVHLFYLYKFRKEIVY